MEVGGGPKAEIGAGGYGNFNGFKAITPIVGGLFPVPLRKENMTALGQANEQRQGDIEDNADRGHP